MWLFLHWCGTQSKYVEVMLVWLIVPPYMLSLPSVKTSKGCSLISIACLQVWHCGKGAAVLHWEGAMKTKVTVLVFHVEWGSKVFRYSIKQSPAYVQCRSFKNSTSRCSKFWSIVLNINVLWMKVFNSIYSWMEYSCFNSSLISLFSVV